MIARMSSETELPHITPKRAWSQIETHAEEFTLGEQDHILSCEQCLELFISCLHSPTLNVVMRKKRDRVRARKA
jgi:hypothetical protein